MTSFRPSVGDIWFACVEFSDHPGVGKVRPVVVDVQESRCTVVAAKVASKDLCSDGSGEMRSHHRLGLVRASQAFLSPHRPKVRVELRQAPLRRAPR